MCERERVVRKSWIVDVEGSVEGSWGRMGMDIFLFRFEWVWIWPIVLKG